MIIIFSVYSTPEAAAARATAAQSHAAFYAAVARANLIDRLAHNDTTVIDVDPESDCH